MGRMNSADEKVFEEALSGALADIQSDWENPDALLLACKDALPPDYVPSCRFSRKIQRLLRRSKKNGDWVFLAQANAGFPDWQLFCRWYC